MNNTTAILELLKNQEKILEETGMRITEKLMPFRLYENTDEMNVLKKIGNAQAEINSAIQIIKDQED